MEFVFEVTDKTGRKIHLSKGSVEKVFRVKLIYPEGL